MSSVPRQGLAVSIRSATWCGVAGRANLTLSSASSMVRVNKKRKAWRYFCLHPSDLPSEPLNQDPLFRPRKKKKRFSYQYQTCEGLCLSELSVRLLNQASRDRLFNAMITRVISLSRTYLQRVSASNVVHCEIQPGNIRVEKALNPAEPTAVVQS